MQLVFIKKLIILIFSLYGFSFFGQKQQINKPSYVIIINDKIETKERLEEYAQLGLIKKMNKGVNQKERDNLAKKFGDKIGDKEFIIQVDLLTKRKETRQNQLTSNSKRIIYKTDYSHELKLNINDSAKDFTVQMIKGQKISLSNLKGKVVLLNYWATWCGPCLMEFAEISEKILNRFKDDDFILVPISIGENKEKVKQKMVEIKKYGINFNVGIDPTKKIWNKYATGAIPKSFVIDQNGVIRYVSTGNSKGNVDKLVVEIEKLLKN